MKKLYQNIVIPGKRLPYEDTRRKKSAFWNEGKWSNFINPLLPRYCKNKTFIEIGSSAGMFLKMAEDKGFKHIVGIEASPARIEEAELYRESTGSHYKLIHEKVDQNFNFNKLPLAHVVLLANTHYYLSIINLSRVVDALWNRTVYCLVVSAKARILTNCARYDLISIRGYFDAWKELKSITKLKVEDDPSPRVRMYGVLFKGALEEYDTNELYDKWWNGQVGSTTFKRDALPPAVSEFYTKVLSGKEFNVSETAYYQYWKIRRPDQTDKWIRTKLRQKAQLAKSIQENGMFNPIYINKRLWRYGGGRLVDGQHRLCIAKILGYKSVLVRVL